MEVDEHRQLAVDHPFGEVLVVLDVEGDLPAGGAREGAGREEGRSGCGALQRRGGERGGCGGGGRWEAADVFRRERPNSAQQQPVSHLRDTREPHGKRRMTEFQDFTLNFTLSPLTHKA